jgi:hypothetical protein
MGMAAPERIAACQENYNKEVSFDRIKWNRLAEVLRGFRKRIKFDTTNLF